MLKLHQDGGSRGRAISINASETPRTLLSATNFENPTALLAKQEMRSWRRLQLESSAMRQPDDRSAPSRISANGGHLAKTLYALEEPENGIHPTRIGAMLQLLRDIAVDVEEPVALDNPLRQVIVNTHSPGVVEKLGATELVVADITNVPTSAKLKSARVARFAPVGIDSWRSRAHPNVRAVTLTSLVEYLTYGDRAKIQESENTSIKQLVQSQLKLNLE